MSVAELGHAASGPWGRSAMTALLIFVALWFDPRVTYMQQGIAENRAQINAIDLSGTRKSQNEYIDINGRVLENKRRIELLEAQNKHIDETLTAILSKLAEKAR